MTDAKREPEDFFERMYRPYAEEIESLPLFGLTVPEKMTREWQSLGVVWLEDGGTIQVEVLAMPARFWRFTIHSMEGEDSVYSTGSGMLSDYWNTALQIAGSMISRNNVVSESEHNEALARIAELEQRALTAEARVRELEAALSKLDESSHHAMADMFNDFHDRIKGMESELSDANAELSAIVAVCKIDTDKDDPDFGFVVVGENGETDFPKLHEAVAKVLDQYEYDITALQTASALHEGPKVVIDEAMIERARAVFDRFGGWDMHDLLTAALTHHAQPETGT